MNILIIINEPYKGMISGWPTRYIGIIHELYKRNKLTILAPGDTCRLKQEFPEAKVCEPTSDNFVSNRFSLIRCFYSFIFLKKDNVLLYGNYYPEFDRLLQSFSKDDQDMVLYFGMNALSYYYRDFNIPVFLDKCDSGLRHLLAVLKNAASFKSKLTTVWDIIYLYRIKRKIVKPDITLLAATERDAFYIRKVLPKNTVYALTNGIDIDKINFSEQYCKDKWRSDTIIFCGSLDYQPNIIAIRYILSEMWESLKNKCPAAKIEIVGRNLSKDLAAYIASYKDVTVYADVPDVFEYYKRAKIVLSPMFTGGGIKNKILEALSTATPVVTNLEGAIGIELKTEVHGYIVESKDELILSTAKILNAEYEQYKSWSANCYSLSKEYSWGSVGDKLDKIIQSQLKK